MHAIIHSVNHVASVVSKPKAAPHYAPGLHYQITPPITHHGIQTWPPFTTAASKTDLVMFTGTRPLTTHTSFTLHHLVTILHKGSRGEGFQSSKNHLQEEKKRGIGGACGGYSQESEKECFCGGAPYLAGAISHHPCSTEDSITPLPHMS